MNRSNLAFTAVRKGGFFHAERSLRMSDGNSNGGGIGFFGLLAIVFIACRLTGFIDWPWWLVLSPIWGSR